MLETGAEGFKEQQDKRAEDGDRATSSYLMVEGQPLAQVALNSRFSTSDFWLMWAMNSLGRESRARKPRGAEASVRQKEKKNNLNQQKACGRLFAMQRNLFARAGPDLPIYFTQNGARSAPRGLVALIYDTHLRPLLNLLLAQTTVNATSMTNVIALCEADNHSRAIVQRLIKYIKTGWISSIPLAENKPEGRASAGVNSHDGTEVDGHGRSNAAACPPLAPRDCYIQKDSGFKNGLGPWKASQPHPKREGLAQLREKHQVAKCLGD